MLGKNEVEFRSITLRPDINTDSDFKVYGYATTFNKYVLLERDGIKIYEQIDRNAFNGADMSDIIMQYNHEGRVLARKSNGSLEIKVDHKGLFVSADLKGSTASRELYEDIKAGLVNKMSWSFIVGEQVYDKASKTRIVKSIKKVFEVGAVAIPANNQTEIGVRAIRDELIERKRQKLRIKYILTVE